MKVRWDWASKNHSVIVIYESDGIVDSVGAASPPRDGISVVTQAAPFRRELS